MKKLEQALHKIDGYLLSIERNVMEGYYELKVGIPTKWAYKSNDKIECETIHETEKGDIVKIYPKEDNVVIDDLIEFVNIIIDTNKKIADMQKQLDEQLEEQQKKMEEYAQTFLEKIDQLKESSFKEMEKKQQAVAKKTKKTTKKETPKENDDALEVLEEKLNR